MSELTSASGLASVGKIYQFEDFRDDHRYKCKDNIWLQAPEETHVYTG